MRPRQVPTGRESSRRRVSSGVLELGRSRVENGRTIPRLAPIVCAATLLAVCSTGAAIAATSSSLGRTTTESLAGTWKGQYHGPYSGTLKLRLQQSGSKLHGSISYSSPKGTFGIHGSVRAGKIKFTVSSVGAMFKGMVKGKSMSGSWSDSIGTGTWIVHKVS